MEIQGDMDTFNMNAKKAFRIVLNANKFMSRVKKLMYNLLQKEKLVESIM